MKLLDRLRSRPPRAETGDPGSTGASSADEQQMPINRFEQLDGNQVVSRLSQLSQVELAALDSNAIARALADADAATVKAVRSYERHHRDRRQVRAEAARALPSHRQVPDRTASATRRPRSSKPVFGPGPDRHTS